VNTTLIIAVAALVAATVAVVLVIAG